MAALDRHRNTGTGMMTKFETDANQGVLRMRMADEMRQVSAMRQGEEGFTLIELLIVMSVMLVLMTLGIPQLMKLRKGANETSAMQSVRTIAQAELQYSSAYPSNGFSCTLSALGGVPGSGAPTPQAAQMLPPDLAAGQKAGYTFAISNCTKVSVNNQDMFTTFQVTAVPTSVGHTGDRGFCSDENNIIKVDPQGGTNCTQPLQ